MRARGQHAIEGLQEYSFVWVMFLFHLNDGDSVHAKVKPPRLEGRKVGVFATRSPHRPNPYGLSLVRLDKIEGSTLFLSGVDVRSSPLVLDTAAISRFGYRLQSCDLPHLLSLSFLPIPRRFSWRGVAWRGLAWRTRLIACLPTPSLSHLVTAGGWHPGFGREAVHPVLRHPF